MIHSTHSRRNCQGHYQPDMQQRRSPILDGVCVISVSIFALHIARNIKAYAPFTATILRLVPIGSAIWWILRRQLSPSHNEHHNIHSSGDQYRRMPARMPEGFSSLPMLTPDRTTHERDGRDDQLRRAPIFPAGSRSVPQPADGEAMPPPAHHRAERPVDYSDRELGAEHIFAAGPHFVHQPAPAPRIMPAPSNRRTDRLVDPRDIRLADLPVFAASSHPSAPPATSRPFARGNTMSALSDRGTDRSVDPSDRQLESEHVFAAGPRSSALPTTSRPLVGRGTSSHGTDRPVKRDDRELGDLPIFAAAPRSGSERSQPTRQVDSPRPSRRKESDADLANAPIFKARH